MRKKSYENEKFVYFLQGSVEHQSIHSHEDIEIILILEGSVHLKIGYEFITLKTNDIMLINSNELHRIQKIDKKNKVLFLFLNKNRCYTKFPDIYEAFAIYDYATAYEKLNLNKNIIYKRIAAIAEILANANEKTSFDATDKLEAAVKKLLKDLIACYMPKILGGKSTDAEVPKEKIEMIYRIIKYLYAHYDRKVNLQEISDQEYFSVYYLSHSIKDITGYTFREWLNFVRVEQAEKLLLSTDRTITDISYACGFSDVRYFNKHFEKWYQITPSQFRLQFKPIYDKKHSLVDYDKEFSLCKIKEYIDNTNICFQNVYINQSNPPIHIEIDLNQISSRPFIQQWLNAVHCNVNYALHPDNKNHLEIIQKEIGFHKICLKGMFHKEIATRNVLENESAYQLFELLKNIHLPPILTIHHRKNNPAEIQQAKSFLNAFYKKYGRYFMNSWHLDIICAENYSKNCEEFLSDFIDFVYRISPDIEISFRKNISSFSENNIQSKKILSIDKMLHTNLKISDLISSYGLKTHLYYFYYLLSLLENELVSKNENYLITRNNNQIQILLFNEENQAFCQNKKYFLISLKNVNMDYKIIYYQWDLEVDDSHNLIKNTKVLNFLSNEEKELVDSMSSPMIYFDYMPSATKHKIDFTLPVRSMRLLLFNPLG